jgi:hypothetical protein
MFTDMAKVVMGMWIVDVMEMGMIKVERTTVVTKVLLSVLIIESRSERET